VNSKVSDEIPCATKQGISLNDQGSFSQDQGIARSAHAFGNSTVSRRRAASPCSPLKLAAGRIAGWLGRFAFENRSRRIPNSGTFNDPEQGFVALRL
jgi:hypothetical protein